jgi:hypothetical protein
MHANAHRPPSSPLQAFYKSMIVDSEYQGEDYDQFSKWMGSAAAAEE